MPSRRFHHKSRHGCAQCKQRKIRCGEERPSCANCNRLGGRCSFLDSDPRGGPLVQSSPESSSSTPQPSGASVHSPERKIDDLEPYDQELLKRWSEATCFTMGDRYDVVSMWQITVPGLAVDHTFLRHGLLAAASMHSRFTSPVPIQSRYLDLATQHQDKALAEYIPQLQSITPENCHALFAFSALLLVIQYSFISATGSETDSDGVVSEVVSVFDYVIGATIIASHGKGWLEQGGLQPLMARQTEPESILPYLVEEPRSALRALMAHVEHLTGGSSTNMPIYVRSIEMLTNAFATEDPERKIFDDMIGWPHYVGGDLVRLLRERDQMALVILAHYGVALNAFSGYWWLQGVGTRLIRAVSQILRPEFLALIKWPLNAILVQEGSQHLYIM